MMRTKAFFILLFLTVAGSAQAYNAADLQNDARKAGSIEKLLPMLPEDLRRNFALQYESHGLMESSYQNPRVIMFGDRGDLVVTFNGDASQSLFNTLEVMEFSKETRTFTLHEIEFSESGQVTNTTNPSKCLGCHGSAAGPRPIWAEYTRWPGMYGSAGPVDIRRDEVEGLRAFNTTRDSHPRYRSLLYHPSQVGKALAPLDLADPKSRGAEVAPNARIFDFFIGYNARRLMTYLRSQPQYPRLLPLVLYFLSEQEDPGLPVFDHDPVQGAEFVKALYGLFGKTSHSRNPSTVTRAEFFALFNLKPRDFSMALPSEDSYRGDGFFAGTDIPISRPLPLQELIDDFVKLHTKGDCPDAIGCSHQYIRLLDGSPSVVLFKGAGNYSHVVDPFLDTPYGIAFGKVVNELWGDFFTIGDTERLRDYAIKTVLAKP